MKKGTLRSKVEGNELDLSFSEMKEIPVKELAEIPKATHLDLSCNLLTTLPSPFCTLKHIIKLDLSKNQITELPVNFGNLENLQHLDLYSNQLRTLPESFHQLSRLKWLDLKNNNLEPVLNSAAGDCLDEQQCQTCAKQVVNFMLNVHEAMEKEREKKQKIAKDKEAKKLAAQERAKEKERLAKKAAKEKRKAEFLKQQKLNNQNAKVESSNVLETTTIQADNCITENTHVKGEAKKGKSGGSAWAVVFGLLVVAIAVYIYSWEEYFPNHRNTTMRFIQENGPKVVDKCIYLSEFVTSNVAYFSQIVSKFVTEKIDDASLWLQNNKYF